MSQSRIDYRLAFAALLFGFAAGFGCDETEPTSNPGRDPICTPAPSKPVGGQRVPRLELMAFDPDQVPPPPCPADPVAGNLPRRPEAPDAGPVDRPDAAS